MLPLRKLAGKKINDIFGEKFVHIQPISTSPWTLLSNGKMYYTDTQNVNGYTNGYAEKNRNGHANGYAEKKGTGFQEEKTQKTLTAKSNWGWTAEFHGMASLLSARTRRGQTFWGIIILTCVTVGAISAYDLIGEYTQSPTATLITIQPTKELMFPKITICPKAPDALEWNNIIASMNSSAMPPIDKITARNVVSFAIAGSGFDKMETIVLDQWSAADIDLYEQLYDMWRGNMTVRQFFTDVIEKNGFSCEDLFPPDGCVVGGVPMNCCAIFEPSYVMRRGRCFSSMKLYQRNVDELGKIVLKMNHLPSTLVDLEGNGIQSEMIFYMSPQKRFPVNDTDEDIPKDNVFISDHPRYNINAHELNRMRIRARFIDRIPNSAYCTGVKEESEDERATCFVSNWLNATIITPFNCTLPYLLDNIAENKPICHPGLIVRNYNAAIFTRSPYEPLHQCLPSCDRWEYDISINAIEARQPFKGYAYQLEASFVDLKYEIFEEVPTITLAGFVSQIGGQLSLFLGISIITCVQFFIHVCYGCYRYMKAKHVGKKPLSHA